MKKRLTTIVFVFLFTVLLLIPAGKAHAETVMKGRFGEDNSLSFTCLW